MAQIRFDASGVPKSVRRNQSPYFGEHSARYVFAAKYATGQSLLDVACGTGYGLRELEQSGRIVIGADLDFAAVKKAKAEVNRQETSLIVADGCSLPFADESLEAITSFETLEHLENRTGFLAELLRILAPEGLCIISTPNANHTQPINRKPRNPHHVFEYTPAQLLAELGKHFQNIQLFGQRLDSRFVISPFWDDQQRLPRSVKMMAGLFLWRVINKLPVGMRDMISSWIWGHTFYPGDEDYQFDQAEVDNARVLIALCRKSAQGTSRSAS